MQYQYAAIDSGGRRVVGEIEASDPDAVVAQLTAQGLRIEQVRSIEGGLRSGAVPTARSGLSAAETTELAGHLSEIVSAGVSLEGGLAALAAEYPLGRMSRTLRSIVRDLEAGDDLESVLARHRSAGYLPALIRAGQRSGRTVEILENFISGSQVVSELRQIFWTALAYPLFLLFQLIPLGLLIFLKLVPGFAELFANWEIKLNIFTAALIDISQFLSSNLGTLALATGVVVLVLCVLYWGCLGPVARRRLLCGIPLFGTIIRWLAVSRFAPLLSSLIEARVPVDEALLLAGDACGDAEIALDCRNLADSLRAGNSLESAIGVTRRLPAGFVRALTWENQLDGMSEVMRSMAEMYAGRARALVMLLVVLLPPFVALFVAGCVATVIVLLFMPLIDLLNKLS